MFVVYPKKKYNTPSLKFKLVGPVDLDEKVTLDSLIVGSVKEVEDKVEID